MKTIITPQKSKWDLRKTLKIIFIFIVAIYFTATLLDFNLKRYNIQNIYFALVLLYVIYEMVQVRKDDVINKTNNFKNRVYFLVAVFVFWSILTLISIYY